MTQTDPNGLTLPPLPTDPGTQSGAIGIPQGYVAPTKQDPNSNKGLTGRASFSAEPSLVTPYGTAPSGHTYNEGQQWNPQNLPPADVYSLQQQLVTAGILNATNLRPGVWDNSSADAYKSVLAFANATGMTAADALKVLTQNPQMEASSARAPVQMTAPADIAAAVSGGGPHQTNAARELVGHDLPASETNDFQKWYQQQEQHARAQYLAAGPGGSYTGAPNVNDAAQVYIKQHNLGEQVAYGTASRMLEFYSLLGGLPGLKG